VKQKEVVMVVVPAVALGALVIFGLGYLLTSTVMTKFAKKTRNIPTFYRWTGVWRDVKHPDEATEEYIDQASRVGGGIAVVLMVLLLFVVPKAWASSIWISLTIIGIIFGLFTFVLREPKPIVDTERKPKPTESPRVSSHVRDELYKDLLTKCRNDRNLAERLIAYERKRAPSVSEEELIRSAIQRWERDKR
jgi:hypothetical protein